MTVKMKMILAVIMTCVMVVLISVAAYAEEEINAEIHTEDTAVAAETVEETEPAAEAEPEPEPEPVPEPEPMPEPEPEAVDDDELVEIDDDWGYISPEVIEQHTPEMTQEFIHADDPDWQSEENSDAAEPETEPAAAAEFEDVQDTAEPETAEPETVQDATEEPAESSIPEMKAESSSDITEETENDSSEVTVEAEEQEEAAAPAVTVSVNASMRSENLLHLKAVVNDPEGNEYDYQWQVSVDGGANYEDVEDQTEEFMDIELDEENISNLWRVRVHTV